VGTKERPKEQVRETRVESKCRRGESRVNRRAENATKVRATTGKTGNSGQGAGGGRRVDGAERSGSGGG